MNKKLLATLALVGIFATTSGCGFLAGMNKDAAKQIKADKSGQASQDDSKGKAEHHMQDMAGAIATMNAGDYKGAIKEADRVIQADSDNDYAYSVKGLCQALDGNVEGGLENVKKAYDLNPHNVANYYNTAMVYKLGGQFDQAKDWFDKVLKDDPNNTWSLYGVATIYADKGQDQEAMTWLKKAIDTNPAVKQAATSQDHFARFHGRSDFEALVK